MNDELRQFVWNRSARTCEYCRVPQAFDPLPFGIDHIRPQYHHGLSVAIFSSRPGIIAAGRRR